MRRLISLSVTLALFATLPARSAVEVTNVRFEQQGDRVIITYDLTGTGSTYAVSVQLSTDGGQSYSSTMRSLSGDVGASVFPGANRRIVWEAKGMQSACPATSASSASPPLAVPQRNTPTASA